MKHVFIEYWETVVSEGSELRVWRYESRDLAVRVAEEDAHINLRAAREMGPNRDIHLLEHRIYPPVVEGTNVGRWVRVENGVEVGEEAEAVRGETPVGFVFSIGEGTDHLRVYTVARKVFEKDLIEVSDVYPEEGESRRDQWAHLMESLSNGSD
jgi:hypothetical protein